MVHNVEHVLLHRTGIQIQDNAYHVQAVSTITQHSALAHTALSDTHSMPIPTNAKELSLRQHVNQDLTGVTN